MGQKVEPTYKDTLESVNELKDVYTQDYLGLLELAYGPSMLSEGGEEGIDSIFQGVCLKDKVALDFGSGLGGVAFYLARTYGTKIVGAEINPAMIEIAQRNTPADLKDKISFELLPDGQSLPFPDNTFDVVYSRGVVVHLTLQQRRLVFQEFMRVLKKGGTLVIHDWLSPKDNVWDVKIEELMASENFPLYAQSPKSYQLELEQAGFKDIEFSDHSKIFGHYNENIAAHLQKPAIQEKFLKLSDASTWSAHIKGYQDIGSTMGSGAVISGLFIAKKSEL